jgi:hypothetical protein
MPGDEVDNLLQVLYFIHLHLSFCVALNSVQYYKMVPYVFFSTDVVSFATMHTAVDFLLLRCCIDWSHPYTPTVNCDVRYRKNIYHSVEGQRILMKQTSEFL